jgi:streptogramin lyase
MLLAWPAILPAQQFAMGDYEVPTYGSQPFAITVGPDGALWFTDPGSGRIGRITTAGAFTEYIVENAPWQIAAGPDGALWFTLVDNVRYTVGRITTAGETTYFAWGTNYWNGITVGPDGALWLTSAADSSSGTIARLTTAGAFTVYPVPGDDNQQMTTGPDGALWFTSYTQIGRITTAGAVTWYSLPTPNSVAEGIAAGPDGALWFVEHAGNNVGRITTAGAITEYLAPNCPCSPQFIITGPDGELWWADQTGRIGEGVFANAGLTATPDNGFYHAELSFAGSGFAPGETVQIYTAGVGSTVLASAAADANGSLTAAGHAPASPNGSRLFLGVGQTSGRLGAAGFSMAPHLFLNPTSGPVGTTVTLSGFGFDAFGGRPGIHWVSPRTLLGITQPIGSHGFFPSFTFKVPEGALPGVNKIYAVDGAPKPSAWGTFTVQ